MTQFLLDNSVIQRLPRTPEVARAVGGLLEIDGELCYSDVSRLEAGYSARSAHDHQTMADELFGPMLRLPLDDAVGLTAAAIQTALFGVGQGRAVGVADLLHAATAIVHDAVVLHYDWDFELLAGVDGRLRHQWVVPQGSVD